VAELSIRDFSWKWLVPETLLEIPISNFVLGPVGRINASARCGFFVVSITRFAGSFSPCPKLTRALSGHASPPLATFWLFSFSFVI